jgi:hypothetical protein
VKPGTRMESRGLALAGIRRLVVILLVCVVAVDSGFACDPCGMHSSVQVPGLINSLRTSGLQAGSITTSLQEQVSTFSVTGENQLLTANEELSLVRVLSVTQLTLGYNLSDEFGLQASLPFVARRFDRFERFQRVSESEYGLGDASLLGTYSPYSSGTVDERIFLALLAGIKAPTGDSGSLKRAASTENSNGEVALQGRGLSLGSGSVDIPAGGVGYFRSGRLVLFTTGLYTFRGEGAAGYRIANDLAWSAAPGWLFVLGEEETITLSLSLSGEHKGRDRLKGEAVSRTASNNIYLGPELFFAMSNRLSLQLSVDLPLSVDVGGAAVEPESRSRFSVSWSF